MSDFGAHLQPGVSIVPLWPANVAHAAAGEGGQRTPAEVFFDLAAQYEITAREVVGNTNPNALRDAEVLMRNTAVAGSPVYEFLRVHWRDDVDAGPHIRFTEHCHLAMLEILAAVEKQRVGSSRVDRESIARNLGVAAYALREAGRRAGV